MKEYDPETYWSRVGQHIQDRGDNYVAGDDNPFYRYKRRKFLRTLLDTIDFRDKLILEVGFGPGGNLRHLSECHNGKKLLGVDISQTMFDLASRNLSAYGNTVELHKIDGRAFPFPDKSVDLSFTVTVLQHNTDEDVFLSLVRETCRVTRSQVVVIEDIGISRQLGGDGSFVSRRVDVYESAFSGCGFGLATVDFLNTRVSSLWHALVFRKIYKRYVNRDHKEGEAIGFFFRQLIGVPLVVTQYLDEAFPEQKGLAKMVFYRR